MNPIEKKKALLVAGGEDLPAPDRIAQLLEKADYVICADRGFDYVKGYDFPIDRVVGDFDSSSRLGDPAYRKIWEEKGTSFESFPTHKDDTDSELALKILLDMGFQEVLFLGGTGSRLDHSFSNILLLEAFSKRGMDVRMEGRNNQVRFLPAGSYVLEMAEEGTYVSFFTLDPDVYLSLEGFEYDLDRFHLVAGTSRAVSNHILSPQNRMEVRAEGGGGVYCFYSKDEEGA